MDAAYLAWLAMTMPGGKSSADFPLRWEGVVTERSFRPIHFFGHTTHRCGNSSHRQRFGISPLPRALAEQAMRHQASR
jgi:hypothetical protein